MEEEATSAGASEKTKRHWLLWWKVEPEELQKQVTNYGTLKFYQSARGISALLMILSAALTAVMGQFHVAGIDEPDYFDPLLAIILAVFLFRGHRWAMIASMLYWTIEKAATIFLITQTPHPNTGNVVVSIIWWSIYMHAFYLAYRTEKACRTHQRAAHEV